MKCRKMLVKKGNKETSCNATREGNVVKIYNPNDNSRMFEQEFVTVSAAKAFFAQETISLQ